MPQNDAVRCGWVPDGDGLYRDYHDNEWGVPVFDDRVLFEFLILEGAQAGLSWRTILGRRDNYRSAFCNFDIEKVASFNAEKINALISDPGIIRNRLKINSAVKNAALVIEIIEKENSFADFIWKYTDGRQLTNSWQTLKDVPPSTPLSDRISSDMKKLGFKFTGTTIMYSFLQAVGVINDHLVSCFRHEEIRNLETARTRFR